MRGQAGEAWRVGGTKKSNFDPPQRQNRVPTMESPSDTMNQYIGLANRNVCAQKSNGHNSTRNPLINSTTCCPLSAFPNKLR